MAICSVEVWGDAEKLLQNSWAAEIAPVSDVAPALKGRPWPLGARGARGPGPCAAASLFTWWPSSSSCAPSAEQVGIFRRRCFGTSEG